MNKKEITWKVTESGCWECTSHKPQRKGYFKSSLNNKSVQFHRLFYEKYKGIIDEGMKVLHTCDNRLCINPEHLFLGTLGENNKDRANKGRSATGEKVGTSKLTEKDVLEIRKLKNSYVEIAKLFNVSPTTIRHIQIFKTWKYLKDDLFENKALKKSIGYISKKLTNEDIKEIRASELTIKELSLIYKKAPNHIRLIKNNKIRNK